ncbi:hypothetical protein [Eikenella corrodens]|nr:hypothetical protein [Eikenella corrodens]
MKFTRSLHSPQISTSNFSGSLHPHLQASDIPYTGYLKAKRQRR